MTLLGTSSKTWYCQNCSLGKGSDLGPWNQNYEMFSKIKLVHHKHVGWQPGEPQNEISGFDNGI